MFPNYYCCSSCHEKFEFKFREAFYYLGPTPIGDQVADDALLNVPVRPAWCKDCDSVTIVEDIAPLRTFEAAYGAVRNGLPIEYPFDTDRMDPAGVRGEIEAYLHWRMGRRHAARALCCGGSNYQFMDIATPLIKHAECEFGFIKGMYIVSGGTYRTPGVYSPIDVRLYDSEGDLAGLLTWRTSDNSHRKVDALAYPPVINE